MRGWSAAPSPGATRVEGWRTGASRRPGAIHLFIVGVCCLFTPSVRAAAPQPWDFATDDEKKQAERNWERKPLFELYKGAQEMLDKNDPSKSTLAEVAERLKRAISMEGQSGSVSSPQAGVADVSYTPYYQLARVFFLQGDLEKAQQCLEQEEKQGKISGQPRNREAFEKLKVTVALKLDVSRLQNLAEEIGNWAANDTIILSAKGPGATDEIKSSAELLGQASASAERQTKAAADLGTKLSKYFSDELNDLELRRGDLLNNPWAGAFPLLADPLKMQCKSSGNGEASRKLITAARDALVECRSRVENGMRSAGLFACEEFAKRRNGVQAPPGQAGGDIPDLQEGSCIRWDKEPARQVATALKRLKNELDVVNPKLDAIIAKSEASGKEARTARFDEIKNERKKLPDFTQNCVQEFQLGDLATELKNVKEILDSATVTDAAFMKLDAKQLVNTLLANLEKKMNARIENIGCPGLVSASIDDLRATWNTQRGRWQKSNLETLCEKIGQAIQESDARCKDQGEAIKTAVNGYTNLLQETRKGDVQRHAGGCLPKALTDLIGAGRQPRTNDQVWIDQARSANGAAQDCLKELQTTSEKSFVKVQQTIARLSERLGKLDTIEESLTAIGSLKQDLDRKRGEVRAADVRLRKAVPLYELPEGGVLDDTVLRAVLNELGLESRVASSAWQLLAAGRDSELHSLSWRAIRDLGMGPEVEKADQNKGQWDELSGSVTAFLALNEAFVLFTKGQPDAAIVTLRKATGAGEIPEGGHGAALVHASLAYFLYTKSVLAGRSASGEVAQALDQDLVAEARKAREAGIQLLPEKLFRSEDFRRKFEALR